jgi:hypothetical protein
MGASFYHFWLCERTDLFPLPGTAAAPYLATGGNIAHYLLPMPTGSAAYPDAADTTGRALTGERQLLTLFTRSGQITTNSIESFDAKNPSLPFFNAQQGGTGDTR